MGNADADALAVCRIDSTVNVATDTEAFEATGYLSPDSSFEISKYFFAYISLTPPATVSLKTAAADEWPHQCPGAIVTRDTLDLSCPGTPVGTINVQWRRTNEWEDPLNQVRALVSVRRKGRVVLSRSVCFHWWEGD